MEKIVLRPNHMQVTSYIVSDKLTVCSWWFRIILIQLHW